jgi:L-rhamnonate dehydratase
VVKIKELRAFSIRSEMVGALYRESSSDAAARRPPWTRDVEVAGPLSGYPRFKKKRSSWRLDGAVGCLVTADDGTTGFGVSRHGRAVISLINDHFAPLLQGENALATERAWDIMVRASSPYGSSGLAAYAISAVDLALWDLKGKILRAPVYELAGGPAHNEMSCYATGNDTDWHMELGFRATKLACPYGAFDCLDGISRNEELVALTREVVGPDVELMLDCWLALDVDFAVRLAERLRPYNLSWIEDALLPDNMDAHASLRVRLPWMTLAGGEHWYMPAQFLDAAKRQLLDVFQPDVCWAGGFTGCQRINHIAETAGIKMILHAGMNTPYGQHLSLASPNMRWGEFFIGSAPGQPLRDAVIFPGMAVPENGRLVPNDEPGFGLGLTEDVLDSLRA